MGSPFSVFRKHQRILIATLGLLAMIAFVFLPIVMQTMGSRSVQDPVVVSTARYGSIKASRLSAMRGQRQGVLNVLQDLAVTVARSKADRKQVDRALSEIDAVWRATGTASQEDVVDTWVMARHAEQLGIVVSDQAIRTFLLKDLTRGVLPASEVRKILQRNGFSDFQFVHVFREELLAVRLQQIFRASLVGTPPAQRWDYFNRFKRKATVELLAIPVDRFAGKVQKPEEEELERFFDEHKQEYAYPWLAEPGFRQRKKIDIEYFVADPQSLATSDFVTEEEIKKRYEEKKEEYDWLNTGVSEEPPEDEKGETEEPQEKPETGEEKEEIEEQEEEQTNEETDGEEEPAEVKEEKSDEADDAAPAPTEAGPDDTSSRRTRGPASPWRLVSLLQDEANGEESAETEPVAENGQPAAEAETPVPEATVPEATEQPAKAEPAGAAEEPIAEPPQPDSRRRGLSPRVKERIRRELAGERIDEVFDRLQERMSLYRTKRIKYDSVDRLKDKNAKPPVDLDFAALAKQHHMTAGRTGMITELDARNLDIGRSLIDGRTTFLAYAFKSEMLPLYRPATAFDLKGNRYLFRKVKESEARVPKFDDPGVRQRVLQTWKMMHARSLARKDAQRLAAAARKANASLKQVFDAKSDGEVVVTSPFTWMTDASMAETSAQSTFMVSQVTGVDYPGPEFMEAVFALKKGGIGVAMNHPKTAAYVIRLTETNPSEPVLWAQFESDPYQRYAGVAVDEQRQIYRAWHEKIRSTAGLKWEVQPDRETDQ